MNISEEKIIEIAENLMKKEQIEEEKNEKQEN